MKANQLLWLIMIGNSTSAIRVISVWQDPDRLSKLVVCQESIKTLLEISNVWLVQRHSIVQVKLSLLFSAQLDNIVEKVLQLEQTVLLELMEPHQVFRWLMIAHLVTPDITALRVGFQSQKVFAMLDTDAFWDQLHLNQTVQTLQLDCHVMMEVSALKVPTNSKIAHQELTMESALKLPSLTKTASLAQLENTAPVQL